MPSSTHQPSPYVCPNYEGLETSRDVTNVVQTAEMQWLDFCVGFKAPEAKIQEYRGIMGMDSWFRDGQLLSLFLKLGYLDTVPLLSGPYTIKTFFKHTFFAYLSTCFFQKSFYQSYVSRSALLKEERNELARAQLSCIAMNQIEYQFTNLDKNWEVWQHILILYQFFLIQSRHSSRCCSTKAESSGIDKTIREFDGFDLQQERRSSPRAIQATRSTSCSLEQSMWSRSWDELGTCEEGPAQ